MSFRDGAPADRQLVEHEEDIFFESLPSREANSINVYRCRTYVFG